MMLASKVFEAFVCSVICFNCVFLAAVTDREVSNPGETQDWHMAVEWFLQVFYTIEVILKLIVHKQYFFFNDSWRLNWFDLFLVALGFFLLLGDSTLSGGFLRSLRLFKFGKALRGFRVLTQVKHLYAIVVCIQGSLSNLFWSLVMLCLVFFMFSLILVQMVATAMVAGTELTQSAEDLYGSVSIAMLTLFKSSTGGDDWSVAYDAAIETGPLAGIVFIAFISFTQLALINIITGTFVEAAMSSLSPSREVLASEHERMEREHANELKSLCHQVDHDRSGKLTPDQFEDGIRRGRIPMLLTLLGLSKSRVIQMFRTLSEQAKHDEGQVSIDRFVELCMQLKGGATTYELQWFQAQVMAEFTRIRQDQNQLLNMIASRG
jgi:voltage-gated sodium channel